MSFPQHFLLDIPTELHGPRIVVRHYRPEDANALWEAVEESREHLKTYMPWVHDYKSPDDAVAFMNFARGQWMSRQDLLVGLFHRETGRYLGGSGLSRINWNLRLFEIGYWVRASEEGRGYISEAVRLQTRLAFDLLGANRVEIRMDPLNERSRRVPERLGFVFEGTLRNVFPSSEGAPRSQHVYSLIPEDYHKVAWSKTTD